MKKYISTKTEYISTDGWRGYVQPINAVAGANCSFSRSSFWACVFMAWLALKHLMHNSSLAVQ